MNFWQMPLLRLKDTFHRVHLFTHTDLDGYGSGAIMVKLLHDLLGYSMESIKVDHVEPSNPYIVDPEDDFVLFTDLSCSNAVNISMFEALVDQMVFTQEPKPILAWWFDHHITSVDVIKDHPALGDIPGIVNPDACGAILCWIAYQYTYLLTRPDADGPSRATLMDLVDLLKPLSENLHSIQFAEDHPEADVNVMSGPWLLPEFAQASGVSRTSRMLLCTDDWDRFVRQDPLSSPFDMAFSHSPQMPRDVKARFWQDFYFMPKDHVDRSNASVIFHELVAFGEADIAWSNYMWLCGLRRNGFLATLDLTKLSQNPGISPREIDFLQRSILFVCCPDARSNFNMVIPELGEIYNFGLLYTDHGDNQTLTIYCYDLVKADKVYGYDARKICQLMGGGGHPGCAGAKVERVPFGQILPFTQEIKDLLDKKIADVGAQLKPALSPMCEQWMR